MKKLWLLFFIPIVYISSLPAIDFLDYSNRSDRTTSCTEVFGYCPTYCLLNRSFMFPRPIYRDIGTQKPAWQDFVFDPEDKAAIQVIPMYQKSFGTRSLAKYFLFDQQYDLLIAGDEEVNGDGYRRDVRAEWIGLPDTYLGSFSIHPKQKQFGIWIEAKVPVSAFIDCKMFEFLWAGIAVPYQIVENNIEPSQSPPINPAPSFPRDALEALSNPALLYGRFEGGKKKVNGFPEIDFKLGYNFLNQDGYQIGMYSMLVIPLIEGQDPHFVFSPFLGQNRHFGYGNAATFKLPMLCDEKCQIFSFFAYFENIYFFRHVERRSLDLIGSPWSRYMMLVNRMGATNIPAINIFTRKVKARCYNMLDLYTGFEWEVGRLQAQIGYGLWARGREKLELDDCFPSDYGLQGEGFIGNTTIPATSSNSTIAFQALNDVNPFTQELEFVPISVQDLDLDSGAARGALCHRVHIVVSYWYEDDVFEAFFSFGGYAEISQYNTGISNLGVWGKVGASF